MGIPTYSGSASSPSGPLNNRAVTSDKEVEVSPDQIIASRDYVVNTYANREAINTGRRTDAVAMLRGFAEGSAIKVTYYHRLDTVANTQGLPKAIDDELSRNHAGYYKILEFELKLTGSLSFEHDVDNKIVRTTGSGITYPGFEPCVGDRFIMEVDTGKFAMMEISEVPVRLSLRSMSYYQIQFILTDWISNEFMGPIEEAVRKTGYFDKQRFLNEPGALLEAEEVRLMQDMRNSRAQLLAFYIEKFYDRGLYNTFMRKDEVYDPYVTDFITRISDYQELGGFPEQLAPDAPGMAVNPFRKILSPKTIPTVAMPTNFELVRHQVGSMSTRLNALMNRYYLILTGGGAVSSSGPFGSGYDSANTDTDGSNQEGCEWPPCFRPGFDPESCKLPHPFECCPRRHHYIHWHHRPWPCVVFWHECPPDGDGEDDPSTEYGNGLLTSLVGMDVLLNTYLEDETINVTALKQMLIDVYSADDQTQFYSMPLLIFFCQKVIDGLHGELGVNSVYR